VNLHMHTFFSFNGYGYSPSFLAWRARLEGLKVAGIIDFDVLDAVEEFLDAARTVGLKACAGMESRVFVPKFSTREINSPGEPGIAYHCGFGFTSGNVRDRKLLQRMKEIARSRAVEMLTRINPYLAPVEVDFEKDVLPLTPNGNATERHLCMAYEAKSIEVFPDVDERAGFWAAKLETDPGTIKALFARSPEFQGLIRSKTMKAGGVGYVKPDGPSFPRMDRVNAFFLGEGAIPAYAWLDGTSAGEQAIEELLDLAMASGVAALNIIPDRNWNIKDPEARKVKVRNLRQIVEIAQDRGLPIPVGTEMNAYGQRFVDDFNAEALRPLIPVFMESAYIMYAHTVLQRHDGMGYLSKWASKHLDDVKAKNRFFTRFGKAYAPKEERKLSNISAEAAPEGVLKAVER